MYSETPRSMSSWMDCARGTYCLGSIPAAGSWMTRRVASLPLVAMGFRITPSP